MKIPYLLKGHNVIPRPASAPVEEQFRPEVGIPIVTFALPF